MRTSLPARLLMTGAASAFSILGGLGMQVSVHAEDAGSANSSTTAADSAQFCKRLPVIEQRITTRQTDLKAKLDDHQTTLSEKEAKWDQAIAAARLKADTERKTAYAELEKAATTDAEKAAVSAYETKTDAGVAEKRAAADAARATFRQQLQDTVTAQVQSLSTELATFSQHAATDLNDAKGKCAAPRHDDSTIAAGFRSSIQPDVSALRQARDDKVIEKTVADIHQKREAERAAVAGAAAAAKAEDRTRTQTRTSTSSNSGSGSSSKSQTVTPAPTAPKTEDSQTSSSADTSGQSSGTDSSGSGSTSTSGSGSGNSGSNSNSGGGRGDGSQGHTSDTTTQ